MEQQQSSGHRPEAFCCSVTVRQDVCHYSKVAERSARREVYAYRGAQPVLERPSDHSARRWCTFDGARYNDTDRCSTSDCMHSKRADMQKLRDRAGERRNCSPPRMAMVSRGSQSPLTRCSRPITDESGYELLMLDGPSTIADDPVVCSATRARISLKLALVLQKRYFVDHPRLQILSPEHTAVHARSDAEARRTHASREETFICRTTEATTH